MKGNCQGCGRWINNGNYCGKCLGIPNRYPVYRNGVQ